MSAWGLDTAWYATWRLGALSRLLPLWRISSSRHCLLHLPIPSAIPLSLFSSSPSYEQSQVPYYLSSQSVPNANPVPRIAGPIFNVPVNSFVLPSRCSWPSFAVLVLPRHNRFLSSHPSTALPFKQAPHTLHALLRHGRCLLLVLLLDGPSPTRSSPHHTFLTSRLSPRLQQSDATSHSPARPPVHIRRRWIICIQCITTQQRLPHPTKDLPINWRRFPPPSRQHTTIEKYPGTGLRLPPKAKPPSGCSNTAYHSRPPHRNLSHCLASSLVSLDLLYLTALT